MKQRYELGDYTLVIGTRPKRHRGAYLPGTRCWTVVGLGHERKRRPTVAQGVLNSTRRTLKVQHGHVSIDVENKLREVARMEAA